VTELLANYFGGQWQAGRAEGTSLFDPVEGHALVRVDRTGLDLQAGFEFSRRHAAPALRALSYRQRAAMLAAAASLLQARRDDYYDIATANSGTVKNDSAVDIDGGIYTLSSYAKLGEKLGDQHILMDGDMTALGKDPLFQSQHILSPTRGLALLINAFNFPSWGLWEKAAPALLSGVPVVVKPATSTAWLTQRMVKDVVDAGIFPKGAISVICGSSAGLMDALAPFDLVSFTGSAETAALIRSHPSVARLSVRANIEADSVNSALLLPDASSDAEVIDLFVKEIAREMTVKSGQKCTAIRRVFVPQAAYDTVAEQLRARLSKVVVGNPRNATVRMGALVNRAQYDTVLEGIALLRQHTDTLFDASRTELVDADPSIACCVGPVLLGTKTPAQNAIVHETEVFGPVVTLMPYDHLEAGLELIRRGEGSLVVSVFGRDPGLLASAAQALADTHGRVHVVSPEVATLQTGHGNVMPQSLHGGPGRAGGGEELGGLRALNFYHRRTAIQASTSVLHGLTKGKT